jgi:hypothetical protein
MMGDSCKSTGRANSGIMDGYFFRPKLFKANRADESKNSQDRSEFEKSRQAPDKPTLARI